MLVRRPRRPPRQRDQARATRSAPPFRPAREDEFAERIGPAGYIGPVGIDVPILLDDAVEPGAYVTGANRDNAHLRGVEPGRDFPFKRGDVRTRRGRATPSTATPIRIEPAIEVGNIFKLGTRYSEPLGATYLDEHGKPQPIWMGSYGIGPARIAAAAVEQFADEQGISWPRSIAPFDVHLVGLGKPGSEERALAERLYERAARDRPGRRSTTTATPARARSSPTPSCSACPLRLTVGRRTLAAGEIEVQVRRGRETRTVPLEGAAAGGRGPVADASRSRGRRARPAHVPPPLRAGPLRPAAAARRVRARRCTRGRSRTRSATSGWR